MLVLTIVGTGWARALAEPAQFTAPPTIANPVAGADAGVLAETSGTPPITLTCVWQDGGAGATPAWTEIQGVTSCTDYVLPASLDEHWLRARVTVQNATGSETATTRSYRVGGEIVYLYGSGSLRELRAMYPDGSNAHQLGPSSTVYGLDEPVISPNGSQIAFISNKDPNSDGKTSTYGIYVMNSDGSGVRFVTSDPGNDFHPSWSPDGTHLLYETGGAIYVVDVDGSRKRLVYNPGDSPGNDHYPVFTRDGSAIVFSQAYEVTPGDPSVVHKAVEDGAPWDGYPWRYWLVTRDRTKSTCSPAESDIHYKLPPEFVSQVCFITPVYALYTVPVGGGTPALLTQPPAYTNGETDPAHWESTFIAPIKWIRAAHQSGQMVAMAGTPHYSINGDFNPLDWHVEVIDPTGSVSTLPATNPSSAGNVSFSPDDTAVLYSCTTSCGDGQLHIVRADGTGDTAIPNAPLAHGTNDWGTFSAAAPEQPPLILVPGIEGTVLNRGGSEVWPNAQGAWDDRFGDDFLHALALARDGVNPADGGEPVTIGGLVGSVGVDTHVGAPAPDWLPVDIPVPFASGKRIAPGCVGTPPSFDAASCRPGLTVHVSQSHYDATVSELEDAGYVLNESLFTFPYDWRLSNSVNGARLADEVHAVLAETGASSVDILAHSQGGLVTLEMLHDDPAIADSVRRVVTLGTPVLGAPKALGVMDFGDPCIVAAPIVGCLYDAATLGYVTRTLPAAYELLPSRAYQALNGTPLIVNGHKESYAEWTSLVASAGDPALEAAGESFHDSLDSFAPLGFLIRILGSGIQTMNRLDVIAVQQCRPNWNPATCTRTELALVGYVGGDGTVPTASAEVPSSPVRFIDEGPITHDDLAHDPSVLRDAVTIFETGTSVRRVAAIRTATAAGLSGIDVEAAGNAALLVTDGTGRRTGSDSRLPSQTSVEEIPGSTFEHVLDTGSAFLRDPGSYHAVATVTGDGSVRIVVRPYANDAIAGQATFFLPDAHAGATLTLDFTDATPLADLRLQVDLNGDGVVDETLSPFTSPTAATDDTPPTTIGGANESAPGTATVTLAADDGSGSGVAATYYELAGDTAPTTYTGPFAVAIGTTVYFRSVDAAGNFEDVRSLTADDVSNERTLAAPLQPRDDVRRFIAPQGDEDWFSFQANGTSTYRALLHGLTEDYDLELYDADGNLVAAPHRRGKASEDIRRQLAVGTYYLRVVGYDGAGSAQHPYQLMLQTLGG